MPIITAAYAYDTIEGETIILVVNNAIYMGDLMEDSLLFPNQCRINGVHIDTRPTAYCTSDDAQSMILGEYTIPITHVGPMPYIPVRIPTSEELSTCQYIELTDRNEWNPYQLSSSISATISSPSPKQEVIEPYECNISHMLSQGEMHSILETTSNYTPCISESNNDVNTG